VVQFLKALVELYTALLALMCKAAVALQKYICSLYIGMRIGTKKMDKIYPEESSQQRGAVWCLCSAFSYCGS
jgi:hypothetical protein